MYLPSISIVWETGGETAVATTTTIDASGITNTDIYAGTAAGQLTATVKDNTGNTITGAEVSWASSNEGVATIDASGNVTLVAEGTTNLIATYNGVSDQYKASEGTYQLTVVDTTPSSDEWVETSLSDLAEGNVFVIVGNNGSNYALSNDNGTSSAPAAVAVTVTDNKITSKVADNIKWNVSGNATDGYTFYPNGSTATWLYCTNTNNGVRVGTNANKTFNIDGNYLKNSATSRYVGIYDSADWRCYTSINSNIENQTFKFYKKQSEGTPVISADDVTLAYDATSGSIGYTISNPVTGTTLTAATDADWISNLTVGESAVTFTTTVNEGTAERSATVTLSYGEVSKTVTVTQGVNPDQLLTISQVREQGTGNVKTKGVVTSVNGKTAYIQDANAAIVVYGSGDLEVAVGDEITVSGTLSSYNGLLEITSPTITVNSNENTVSSEVMTIEQVNASTKQGWLVKVENATVSEINSQNVTIAQGENTIEVRFNSTDAITFGVNDVISLTANIGCYNSVQLANPTDVSVTPSTRKEVTLTFSPESVTATATGPLTDVPTLTVTDADGKTVTGLTITYSSSNETIATVDATTGAVNIVDYGTATITATSAETTEYLSGTASYTLTVTKPVTPTDSEYVKITSTDDLTDGEYLIVYEKDSIAFDGSLETLDAVSNTIEVTIENNKIAGNTEVDAATFIYDAVSGTLKSASGYYIGQTSDANGLKSSKTEAYTNTIIFDDDDNANILSSGGAYLRYNDASNQTRFRYFKSSTYTGQKAIALYKKVDQTQPDPEAYAVVAVVEEGKTSVTFYYDGKKATRVSEGTIVTIGNGGNSVSQSWAGETLTSATFDPSFRDYTGLTSVNSWFFNCSSLTSIEGLTNLNTENVTTMESMFNSCSKLTSLDLSSFNTEKVTVMSSMFAGCSKLTRLDLSSFNTEKVTLMSSMFTDCKALTSITFGNNFNTSSVTYMLNMFHTCSNLNSLDLSGFNTSKVTTMSQMFYGCSSLTSLDLSSFNTSSVKTMSTMFNGCKALTSITFGENFNTEKVTDMQTMFSGCSSLTSLNLSNFNTSKVTTMRYMFSGCSSLTSLDLSKFDTSKVTTMAYMFNGCSNLKTIYVTEENGDWNKETVTTDTNMFSGCNNLVGGAGTIYEDSKIDKEYARIEGPGYFTCKRDDVTVTFVEAAKDGDNYYATLYYSDRSLNVPEGVTAYAVTVDGALKMTEIESVIPAGTAVLLEATSTGEKTFSFTTWPTNVTVPENMLRGSDVEETTTGPDEGSYKFYKLTTNKEGANLGFYYGTTDGGAFTNGAHKAYLAVPAEAAVGGAKGFALNGETDGIEAVVTAETDYEHADVYTLSGQRVARPTTAGVYIVNGKKVVIK